jgi:hypothetical protein
MYSKKGWGVVQVVDLLPRKYKAIISNPSTAKKKKKGTHLNKLFTRHLYIKCNNSSWVPHIHASNPSYLGGRKQEDQGCRPAQATKVRPYLKNIQSKKGLVEWHKW